ncbi:unnamed protein product [Nezara viridula]|uniref:Uncharacterized protein n=1 Tax=Nezara viridula TaxID=85310 RepID=A0A9P0H778_NEZVI|nr:unnamed protein product [Nezara viridula]
MTESNSRLDEASIERHSTEKAKERTRGRRQTMNNVERIEEGPCREETTVQTVQFISLQDSKLFLQTITSHLKGSSASNSHRKSFANTRGLRLKSTSGLPCKLLLSRSRPPPAPPPLPNGVVLCSSGERSSAGFLPKKVLFYVARMENEAIPKMILTVPLYGTRMGGRPKLRWQELYDGRKE